MHLAILPETWKGATLCHAGEPQGLLLDIVFTGKLSATALRIMKLLLNPHKYVVNWCKLPVNHQIVVFVEYCQHAHACCLGTYTCSFHISNITVPPKWFVCHTPIWWLPKMGGSPSHVVSIHIYIYFNTKSWPSLDDLGPWLNRNLGCRMPPWGHCTHPPNHHRSSIASAPGHEIGASRTWDELEPLLCQGWATKHICCDMISYCNILLYISYHSIWPCIILHYIYIIVYCRM